MVKLSVAVLSLCLLMITGCANGNVGVANGLLSTPKKSSVASCKTLSPRYTALASEYVQPPKRGTPLTREAVPKKFDEFRGLVDRKSTAIVELVKQYNTCASQRRAS